ncbi:putative universal ribosomal protein uS5 family protein [Lyophyllum shimeji]|uniref:Universal ribosomal protein uS5 family protein n=1 Tax=Lyophyllum shimeji TaxID=47721 RepID=A0A9P3PT03_LYOSH|nr:putative universal ribosomal protein uS5 family protein [Lyophyllum shimeji]
MDRISSGSRMTWMVCASDPPLDSRDVLELPSDKDTPFHNRVIVRNHSSTFNEALAEDGFDFGAEDYVLTRTDMTEESVSSLVPFSLAELANCYRFPLIHKRITQQTGKGKIHRQFVLMVVGNGDGMVGLGQGKDGDALCTEVKAFVRAVRNLDWVEQFERRTIWMDIEMKLGTMQLIMRPRPVGFGLRCGLNLHQVLKAAGIKNLLYSTGNIVFVVSVLRAVLSLQSQNNQTRVNAQLHSF